MTSKTEKRSYYIINIPYEKEHKKKIQRNNIILFFFMKYP